MVIQRKLRPEEIQNMPQLNRQAYGIITSFGDGYTASATDKEVAEVISLATNKMAMSIGLSDAQDLSEKLKAIKAKRNIKDLEGLKDYFKVVLKKKIKEALLEAGLDPELIEEIEEREQEREEDRIQDQEQNQDLFILKADSERVHEREIEERNAMDRQKQIQEKALRVLEAMEKARDAIEKGKPIPEIDLSYLRELTPDEFSQQMNAFKKFGLQPIAIMKDGELTRENPERQITKETITKETITKEDFEQGDIAFAIQFDKLVDPNWRENVAEKYKAIYERSGFDIKYRSETTKADDLIYSTKGNEATEKTGQVKEDDDKEYR